jgi:hypothetical protein
MKEAIVGPIATFSLAREVVRETGSPAAAQALGLFLSLPHASGGLGATCAQLDTYAFGDVHYDASAGTLSIDVRDQAGNPICPTITLG